MYFFSLLSFFSWLIPLILFTAPAFIITLLLLHLFKKKDGDPSLIDSSNFGSFKNKNEIIKLIEEHQSNIEHLEEQKKKLIREERESTWREMAKLVAHDIKNPLTPLKLGVQLLQKSWAAKDPNFGQKFEKLSGSLIEQIENLSRIATEFSDFAKVPDMVLERVELRTLVTKIILICEKNYAVPIVFRNRSGHKIWIDADEAQLVKSLSSLIRNAVNGTRDVTKGEIKIRLSTDEWMAQIEIADNGLGIANNLNDQLFTPSFTTKTSGTGLSLALAKQSLVAIGAELDFEAKAGSGCIFYIRIPLAK